MQEATRLFVAWRKPENQISLGTEDESTNIMAKNLDSPPTLDIVSATALSSSSDICTALRRGSEPQEEVAPRTFTFTPEEAGSELKFLIKGVRTIGEALYLRIGL